MTEKYNIETARKERVALRRYAAIQKAAEEKVSVQKIYVDIAGSLEAAFVLDELIYFTLPRDNGISGLRVRKDGYLWLAVSRTEWWDRKRLTAKQADGAIERLVKENLVFKELFLFNKQKTTHLRLNVPEFFRRYMEKLEKDNPAEDESDTTAKDVADLYEMMGIPKRDTPAVRPPKREQGIPKGEGVSPNGDSINIPHTSLTQPIEEEEGEHLEVLTLKKLYEQNIGVVTPLLMQMFRNAAMTYPEEWFQPAFEVMVKSAKHRSWSFVEAVLQDWKDNGFGHKPSRNEKRSAPAGDGWLERKERELANGNA